MIDFLKKFLPIVYNLGEIALDKQKTIKLAVKNEPGFGGSLITETDFLVQKIFMEFLIRTRLNDEFNFFGEEKNEEISKLQRDFNLESPITIAMDPIDNTASYGLGFSAWGINITLFKDGILDEAIIHTPYDGRMYYSSEEEENSWIWEVKNGKFQKRKFVIPKLKDDKKKLITAYMPKELTLLVRKLGFALYEFDLGNDVDGGCDPRLGQNRLYTGEVSGFFRHKASALDWVPISYIARKAGAIVTSYEGETPEDLYRCFKKNDGVPNGHNHSILTTTDRGLHRKLVDILKDMDIYKYPYRF